MKKTKSEHALSLIKASVSAVPVVGGSLSSLIGDYVPTATQRSIEEALDYLKKKLAELEDRIDIDSINKDQFSELFKSSYLCIVRTHHKSRLKGVASLLANILLKDGDPDKLSYTELDHFSRCLEALSVGAIEVLGHAISILKKEKAKTLESYSYRIGFNQLREKMPDISPSLLMGLIGELNSMNLFHLPSAPAIRTHSYGNYNIELTPLGERFVEKILEDKRDKT